MATRTRTWALLMAAALSGLALAGPTGAVEDGLMGVRIGASYREILRRLGHSTGILFSAGGSMMYQTQPSFSATAGLPAFQAEPTTGQAPVWVLPLRPSALSEEQSEWVYDWRQAKGVALGIILSGKGADAVVTDVVVAGFRENLKGKPQPVRTEKGIVLQSTFAEVLEKYGYPPVIEIYTPSAGAAGAAGAAGGAAGGGRAMRAAGSGARGQAGGGRRANAGGGRRGGGRRSAAMGRALDATTLAVAAGPRYQLDLTGGERSGRGRSGGDGGGGRRVGAGGGRRGAAGGGRRAGGGGGVRAGTGGGRRAAAGGRGSLPPLGQAALAGTEAALTASAIVNNQAVGFSRDCILTYEGIAFTMHDLRVVRIHVSE